MFIFFVFDKIVSEGEIDGLDEEETTSPGGGKGGKVKRGYRRFANYIIFLNN